MPPATLHFYDARSGRVERDADRFEQFVTGNGLRSNRTPPVAIAACASARSSVAVMNPTGDFNMRGAQPQLHVQPGGTEHMHVENHTCRMPRRERSKKRLAGPECGDFIVG